MTTILKFEKELAELINKHSLENMIEMPDFLMANLIVSFLRSLHIAHLGNNDWHGMKAYHKEIQDPCFAEGIAASRAAGLDRLIAKDIKDKK